MKKFSQGLIGVLLVILFVGGMFALLSLTDNHVHYDRFAWPLAITILSIAFLLTWWLKWRDKHTHWTGVVIEKKENVVNISTPKNDTSPEEQVRSGNYIEGSIYPGANSIFVLIVRTDKGKKVGCNVPGEFYASINVGDTLIKQEGELYPKLVSKASDVPLR